MRIFPTSDAASISYAENLRDFRTRGVEPHSAWSSGLARSSYWRFFADGAELPVYDTPVTHGGPHSFVVIPFDASELTAKSIPPLRSAEILPESLHLSGALCGQELHFSAPEAYNLLIEANGSHLHPLAVFRAMIQSLPRIQRMILSCFWSPAFTVSAHWSSKAGRRCTFRLEQSSFRNSQTRQSLFWKHTIGLESQIIKILSMQRGRKISASAVQASSI